MDVRRPLIHLAAAFSLAMLLPTPGFAQDPGVSSEIERTATATPEEMLAYADDANDDIREVVKRLAKLDEAVRREGDEGGMSCVSNSLVAAGVLLQVSEAAESSLQNSLSIGQRERAEHEFRKIAIALKKAHQLEAEGERCALGEGVQDGKTRVKVDGPSGTVDDTRAAANDVLDMGFDPPDASPF